jgi:hypothetical protein
MISKLACTKCNGQVIERDGLDGMEQLCLNCGFGQIPNTIPTKALGDESLDLQRRNQGGRIYTKYESQKDIVRDSGGNGRFANPRRSNTRQKVTLEQIESWNKFRLEVVKLAKEQEAK